jgi:hypothetical protein
MFPTELSGGSIFVLHHCRTCTTTPFAANPTTPTRVSLLKSPQGRGACHFAALAAQARSPFLSRRQFPRQAATLPAGQCYRVVKSRASDFLVQCTLTSVSREDRRFSVAGTLRVTEHHRRSREGRGSSSPDDASRQAAARLRLRARFRMSALTMAVIAAAMGPDQLHRHAIRGPLFWLIDGPQCKFQTSLQN